jgi:hypothetical protein
VFAKIGMMNVLCNGGRDEGVYGVCDPSSLSTSYQEETVGCMAERRHGKGKGVRAGIIMGGIICVVVVLGSPSSSAEPGMDLKGVQNSFQKSLFA